MARNGIGSLGARTLVAVIVLVTSPLALTTAATAYDGTYNAVLRCDALPNDAPLRATFPVTITDGRAQYARDLVGAREVIERGTGVVSAEGDLELSGSVTGDGFAYQFSYRGRFGGEGFQLSGTQQWRWRNGRTFTRPCTATLTRAK